MIFDLTPAQFAALKTQLANDHSVTLIQLGQNGGTLTARGVTFNCGYDGAALTVAVAAKHGVAAMAGDDEIYTRLAELLRKYLGEQA